LSRIGAGRPSTGAIDGRRISPLETGFDRRFTRASPGPGTLAVAEHSAGKALRKVQEPKLRSPATAPRPTTGGGRVVTNRLRQRPELGQLDLHTTDEVVRAGSGAGAPSQRDVVSLDALLGEARYQALDVAFLITDRDCRGRAAVRTVLGRRKRAAGRCASPGRRRRTAMSATTAPLGDRLGVAKPARRRRRGGGHPRRPAGGCAGAPPGASASVPAHAGAHRRPGGERRPRHRLRRLRNGFRSASH
jgi:hypothetical protein